MSKNIFFFLCLLFFINRSNAQFSCQIKEENSQTKEQIKSKYKYSIGTIGIASAYVISSDGLIVTAYHNLLNRDGNLDNEITIKFPEIPNRPEFICEYIAGEFNPPNKRNQIRVDLALLKIKDSEEWIEAMTYITPIDIHFRTISRKEYVHFYFTRENQNVIAVRRREIARPLSKTSFLSEDTVIGGASGSPLINLFGRAVGTCYHGESKKGSFYNDNNRLFVLLKKVQTPKKINDLYLQIIKGEVDDTTLLSYMNMIPGTGINSKKISDLDLFFLARKIGESSKNFEKGYQPIGCSLLETLISKGFGLKEIVKIFPKRFASLIARDLFRKTNIVSKDLRKTFLLASKEFYEQAMEYNTSLNFNELDQLILRESKQVDSDFKSILKYPILSDNPKYTEEISTLMIDYGKTLNELSNYEQIYHSKNKSILFVLKGFEISNSPIKQSRALETIGDMIARDGKYKTATELYSEAWARGNRSDLIEKNYSYVAVIGDINARLGEELEPSSVNTVVKKVLRAIKQRL